ncbi:uncharacterized protein PgNI_03747, partial [Pyricularia grisea]|uniref:Secreted protein n=1 Tax=Pyricularia grisea TaxID=148305 RepID=A0A6P8BE27_PYRGI
FFFFFFFFFFSLSLPVSLSLSLAVSHSRLGSELSILAKRGKEPSLSTVLMKGPARRDDRPTVLTLALAFSLFFSSPLACFFFSVWLSYFPIASPL